MQTNIKFFSVNSASVSSCVSQLRNLFEDNLMCILIHIYYPSFFIPGSGELHFMVVDTLCSQAMLCIR